jgi:RNA polymerase primary sigma factor
VLGVHEERELLRALADCKRKLSWALARLKAAEVSHGADDEEALVRSTTASCSGDKPTEGRLGAVVRRYQQIRGKLVLANTRLVAHVARRFRDRGVADADLIQEGFCGLLEAIDRFDLDRQTKLSTYATWWIRQAMQRAVASGAYPVRLTPRHLRELARRQDELEPGAPASDLIHRIHTATRPTLSLDAPRAADRGFSLLQTMSDREGDRTGDVDRDEAVSRLLEALRPREQEVLALRFGLGGEPGLSLSQVGKVLEVSKERVRQIQDRALEKLRAAAEEQHVGELLLTGA